MLEFATLNGLDTLGVQFEESSFNYLDPKWGAEEACGQITTGCGGNFCPGSYVTRAAMAGLIVHAFDIPYKSIQTGAIPVA